MSHLAEYRARAIAHRPTDQAALAREAKRLKASGLKERDIAAALGMSTAAVEQMLREVA